MIVAQIAFEYGLTGTGGACIAASRLHNALLKCGVESHYICWNAAEPGKNVHVLPRGILRMAYYYLARCTHYGFEYTPFRKAIPLNIFPMFGLEKELKNINPDVVHVQWINEDVVSFGQLRRLPYPLVFSLHDLWMLNAIDPCPIEDHRFVSGFRNADSNWLERWLYNRKRALVQKRGSIFIGPSEWVCRECRRSFIGRRVEVRSIPNVMDSAYFEGGCNKESHRRFLVLYGANGGRKFPVKGFADLESALRSLPDDIQGKIDLHVFGESFKDYQIGQVHVHSLGVISGAQELAGIYRSADLLALPSRFDNAPQVKFEALACGTPVVTFQRAGCAEFVEHRKNGWVASDGDVAGFAAGIEYFYKVWLTEGAAPLRAKISEDAARCMRSDVIVPQYVSAYRSAVDAYQKTIAKTTS